MAAITWDDSGKHLYETGIDHMVLYRPDDNGDYTNGVAWNGITAFNETPSGADSNPVWADNIKYLDLRAAEEFGATLECLYTPAEFAECDGVKEVAPGILVYQQARQAFGLSYRTLIGNEVKGNELGYKLHLLYNATAAPSEKSYNTVNDSPETSTLSYELTTTPIAAQGFKNTALITIDSTKVAKTNLTALENVLYGVGEGQNVKARLPKPQEVFTILGLTYDSQTGTWS